jgi:integrase
MPTYPPHIDPAKKPTNTYFDHRGKGRWVYRRSNGRGDRGKEIYLGDASLTLAQLHAAASSVLSAEVQLNFAALADRFRASQDYVRLTRGTQQDYEKCVKSISGRKLATGALMGQTDVSKWTTVGLRKFRDMRAAESPSRAKKELAFIKRLFVWAVEYGHLQENVAKDVTTRGLAKAREHYVTDGDYMLALNLAPLQVALIMHLCLLTGRRRLDVLALTLDDMDDEGIYFVEGKTGKASIVLWSDELQQLICTIGFSNERLFDMSVAALDTAWQRLMVRVSEMGGTRFQLKDLRAKHASDMEDRGGDATANLLHSSRNLTRRHYLRKPTKVNSLR